VPPRSAAAMAYDDATGQLVLFGGDIFNGKDVALADTWIWNGTTWSQRDVSPSPAGRIGAAMAYDPASKQLLLFSGAGTGGTSEDDTWIWNGLAWHEARPATNPPPRTDAAIAYDPLIGRIVMFGGWNPVSGEQSMYDDTWTWDGTNWTKLLPSTSPPARAEAVMAYDVVSNTLVVFGGEGDVTPYSNQTWTFDGHAWELAHFRLGATQPAARDATVMAADDANQTIVLFGGEESGGNNNDTWIWNGFEWVQVHPRNTPPARGVETESGMMTYDPELGVDVLYGGPVANPQGSLGDTWTWNGSNWTEVSNNGPVQPARGGC
jgi:Kelch motif